MIKYYLHDGKVQLGPFTVDELKQHNINKDSLIWTEGMADWKKAEELEDLKTYFASVPPPLKTPTQLNAVPEPPQSVEKPRSNSKFKFYFYGAFVLLIALFWFYNKTKNDAIQEVVKIQEQKKEIEEGIIEEENQEKKEKIDKRKKYIRTHIWKYFDTKATYNAAAFGGITNALVGFYNNSEYPIDEVIVRVFYIKDNGAIWTTHDVTITNIAAKGSSMERSDDSNRGTKLRTEIISIRAKSLKLCFYGISEGEDPYFCQ